MRFVDNNYNLYTVTCGHIYIYSILSETYTGIFLRINRYPNWDLVGSHDFLEDYTFTPPQNYITVALYEHTYSFCPPVNEAALRALQFTTN